MDLDLWLDLTPLAWSEVITALVCGCIVGLERQLRGKPVGIRTSTLITLGTYVFVTAAFYVADEQSDPSRIIGQVVTGIGFLGAGVMLARDGAVIGVTSAAAIWALASVGVCIAVGESFTAIKLSVILVGILAGIDFLEGYSTAFTRGVHRRYSYWRADKTTLHDQATEE